MKYRILMWAVTGFFVAGFWALYFTVKGPGPITSAQLTWNLARLSCPIAFASIYFSFPVGVYWSLLANAATYALVGLAVEPLRRRFNQAK